MKTDSIKKVKCVFSGQMLDYADTRPVSTLLPPIRQFLESQGFHWQDDERIGNNAYQEIRKSYFLTLLEKDQRQLGVLEQDVLDSFSDKDLMAADTEAGFDAQLRFADRLSDQIAEFGGSWKFIISFIVLILIWMIANVWWLGNKQFDPYPFILLNLVLSCLAAFQAPVIMMSQRRQESRDRLRAKSDYKVNLKAELEIRMLHEKMDFLIQRQSIQFEQLQQQMRDIEEDIEQVAIKK